MAWLVCRSCCGGEHWWPRGVEELHVPPALHLPGSTSEGHGVHVTVGRHELGACVPSPGCLLLVGLTHVEV